MRQETSSSRFGEDSARAGEASTPAPIPRWPSGPLRGPNNFAGAAASLADGDADRCPSVREDKQQKAIPPVRHAARTQNPLQLRVDELVLALALVNAENNVLRRQLAELRTERDTWRAEAMTG